MQCPRLRTPPCASTLAHLGMVLIHFLSTITEVKSANILVVYHPVAKSHSMFLQRTAIDLEASGHSLTYLHTPLTESARKLPGSENMKGEFKVIPLRENQKFLQDTLDNMLWARAMSLSETYKVMFSLGRVLTSQCKLFADSDLKSLIGEKKFDLVLADPTFAPCVHVIADTINAPYLESAGISFLVNQAVAHGATYPFSYATGSLLPLGRATMDFWQRIWNSVDLSSNLLVERYFFGVASGLVPDNRVTTETFLRSTQNISGYFINDNNVLQPPRPTVSSIHLLGGPEETAVPPLPQDIEDFIMGNHSGIIIMSLSTMSPSTKMSAEFKELFINNFRRLGDYKIIWRYEGSLPAAANLPNVKLVSWLPLKSLLGHERTVAMVSHGGINSVMESMHFGVPLVGIPLYGDQASVLSRIQDWGAAKVLTKEHLSEQTFWETLQTVLHNESYKRNMVRCKNMVRDRIASPRKEGLFWTEHLLKRKGVAAKWTLGSSKMDSYTYFGFDIVLPTIFVASILLLGYSTL